MNGIEPLTTAAVLPLRNSNNFTYHFSLELHFSILTLQKYILFFNLQNLFLNYFIFFDIINISLLFFIIAPFLIAKFKIISFVRS